MLSKQPQGRVEEAGGGEGQGPGEALEATVGLAGLQWERPRGALGPIRGPVCRQAAKRQVEEGRRVSEWWAAPRWLCLRGMT